MPRVITSAGEYGSRLALATLAWPGRQWKAIARLPPNESPEIAMRGTESHATVAACGRDENGGRDRGLEIGRDGCAGRRPRCCHRHTRGAVAGRRGVRSPGRCEAARDE